MRRSPGAAPSVDPGFVHLPSPSQASQLGGARHASAKANPASVSATATATVATATASAVPACTASIVSTTIEGPVPVTVTPGPADTVTCRLRVRSWSRAVRGATTQAYSGDGREDSVRGQRSHDEVFDEFGSHGWPSTRANLAEPGPSRYSFRSSSVSSTSSTPRRTRGTAARPRGRLAGAVSGLVHALSP